MNYTELIGKMTLEEKASLLSGKDCFQTKTVERLGIPSMFLSDGPHGVRKQAGAADHLGLNASLPATCFPTSATVANSWDTTLGEELGHYLGKEAVSQRVSVLLGPGLNIKRSPLCGRNFEYFSEDPYLAGKMAASYIRGIQSQGISACPKHLAANSQEYLRMSNDSVVDERTLREIYLTGFEIAVKEGAPLSIMSSYNRINGVFSNENPYLLRTILVDEWGFQGFVVSDWGGSNDHVAGVAAGSQLEMPSTGGDSDRELVKAVKSGKISQTVLDQRVEEFLRVLFATRIPEDAPTSFDQAAHHAMARRATEASIVLLKNENNLLPLAAGTRVAVLGDFAQTPRYQGAGSSLVNATQLDHTLDAMEDSGLVLVGYEPGFLRAGGSEETRKASACTLAKSADVVLLYLGLDELGESEGLDRPHMRLSQNQVDLLAAVHAVNSNIVVVLSCGCAIETPWLNQCQAVVHGYLSGQAGAGAMLNVLTGAVCPSGKLSETYPLSYEDTPAAHYYPGQERTSEYREGIFVGYRYYDTAEIPVAFPFGHGLSYTKFSYSDLTVTPTEAAFVLTNTGDRAGAEVAQLYVSAQTNGVFRPKKELKGFCKVFLEPGEQRRITIPLDDKAFRYFNIQTHHFEVEGGNYELFIGASSADLRLSGSIKVAGTNAPNPYDATLLSSYYSGQVSHVSDEEFQTLLGRPIPPARWDRSQPLERNDVLSQMCYAKSALARFAYRTLMNRKQKADAKGSPDLNILFIINMPFRGVAKMAGGAIDLCMVDALLEVVNGHFFRGMGHLIGAWFRKGSAQKDTMRKLAQAGTAKEVSP